MISLLRWAAREELCGKRLLVLVDSRVVLGLAYDIALEVVWVPTWANPADATSRSKSLDSWYASLPKLPPPPTAVFASAHALSEQDLLREPLSVGAHAAGEHVR